MMITILFWIFYLQRPILNPKCWLSLQFISLRWILDRAWTWPQSFHLRQNTGIRSFRCLWGALSDFWRYMKAVLSTGRWLNKTWWWHCPRWSMNKEGMWLFGIGISSANFCKTSKTKRMVCSVFTIRQGNGDFGWFCISNTRIQKILP